MEETFIYKTMNINVVLDPTTVDLLEIRQLLKTPEAKQWRDRAFNELVRLEQGSKKRTIKCTNTINFILPNQKPMNKKSTYARIFASYQPQKENTYLVWITIGGDKIYSTSETFTPNADINAAK